MAVERRLTEIAGPVGGKLHTARSRNDQVATDVAMFVRDAAPRARGRASSALMAALVDAAERHLDWPLPGYTHLQRAQPVYLAHHLLAYVWMLERDRERFALRRRAGGAAAARRRRAGRRELRHRPAAWSPRELGFAGVAPNSIDAVSNRDFVLDYLAAARDLRDAPLAPGRRARAVVERGVRLRASSRRLDVAARRSCPRRRTPTPPSCCAPRRRGSSATWPPCTASCTRSR